MSRRLSLKEDTIARAVLFNAWYGVMTLSFLMQSLSAWDYVGILISALSAMGVLFSIYSLLIQQLTGNRNLSRIALTGLFTILLVNGTTCAWFYYSWDVQTYTYLSLFSSSLIGIVFLLTNIINVEILSIFGLLDPSITPLKIKLMRGVIIGMYMLCMVWNWISLFKVNSAPEYNIICFIYDNVQSVYLITLIYKTTKDREKLKVKQALKSLGYLYIPTLAMQWVSLALLSCSVFQSSAKGIQLVPTFRVLLQLDTAFLGIQMCFIIYVVNKMKHIKFPPHGKAKFSQPAVVVVIEQEPKHLLDGADNVMFHADTILL